MVILEILGRYEVRYPEIKCIRDRSCKRYNPCTSSIYEWGSGWYYSKWSGTKSRLEIAEIQGSLIVFPQSSPLLYEKTGTLEVHHCLGRVHPCNHNPNISFMKKYIIHYLRIFSLSSPHLLSNCNLPILPAITSPYHWSVLRIKITNIIYYFPALTLSLGDILVNRPSLG